jgi:hypothetical protein
MTFAQPKPLISRPSIFVRQVAELHLQYVPESVMGKPALALPGLGSELREAVAVNANALGLEPCSQLSLA